MLHSRPSLFTMGIESRRFEHRYHLTPAHTNDFLNTFKTQEIIHENPWVTTLYLGSQEGFLQGEALKVRFHGKTPSTQPFILNETEKSILELKLSPRYHNESPRRRKFRIDLPLGEVLSVLESANSFEKLAGYSVRDSETPFPVGLLHAICKRENITGFVPRGGTSYQRRHFVVSDGRITVDSDITFWRFIRFYKDWYAIPIGKENQEAITELKLPQQTTDTDNQSILNTTGPIEKAAAKFQHLQNLTITTPVNIINPEMHGSAEDGDWDLIEREFKLDLSADARHTINTLLFDSDIYSLSRVYESTSYQQFIIVGDGGICIMGKGGKDKPDVIKVKVRISEDEVLYEEN